MIKLSIRETGEVLGIFPDWHSANEWHDNWCDQFADEQNPSCIFEKIPDEGQE